MPDIKLAGHQCCRCKHEWCPANKRNKPEVCPKCKSPYWDKPKRLEDYGNK